MGDPALRSDDNIDDDEFFSPAAFKSRDASEPKAGAAADDEYNAPEAFKKPGNSAEAPREAPKAEPGILERFLHPSLEREAAAVKSATPGAVKALGDTVSGVNSGITGGLDTLLPFGIGDTIKADREASDPRLVSAGQVAGTFANPIARAAGAAELGAGVGGITANAVRQGAVAGAIGAEHRYADQEPGKHDVLQALLDSRGDAETGAALGGGSQVLGELAGGASGLVKRGADWARGKAFGVNATDVGNTVDQMGTVPGLAYAKDELRTLPEKLGLTKWWKPQSAEDYAKGASALREEGGALKGSALERADAVVPPEQLDLAKDDVLSRLVAGRDADRAAFSSEGTAGPYEDLTSRMQDRVLTKPSELDAAKQAYERNSYAKGPGTMEAGVGAANKVAADEARNRLGGIISGANRSDPGIAQDFARGSEQYGDAKTVEDIASRAAAHGYVAPLVGAAAGGYAGLREGHDWQDGLAGAALGAGAMRLGQTYGADLGATVGRGVQHTLGAASTGLNAIASNAGALEAAKDASAMGRGHELPSVVKQLLIDNPDALGKYRGQFEQAGRDPAGIAMLLVKLNAKDPEWKAGIGAQLQRMTGNDQ